MNASSLKFQVQYLRGTEDALADALWRVFRVPRNELFSACCEAFLSRFSLLSRDLAALQREHHKLPQVIEKLGRRLQVPTFSLLVKCTIRLDVIAVEMLSYRRSPCLAFRPLLHLALRWTLKVPSTPLINFGRTSYGSLW
jgi:hypothetical protein